MPTFNKNIFELAHENRFFCLEIVTNEFSQVVLMSIEPGSDIGERVHEGDQVLVIVEGSGEAVLNRRHSAIEAGSLVAVPSGARHNIINTGTMALKLFVIYAPPEEAPRTLHRTKAEADAAEAAEEDDQPVIMSGMVYHSNAVNQPK